MEDKLKLSPGERLRQETHQSKGPMAETDIYTYSVVDSSGEIVGSVTYTDHTSINGFKRRQTVEQRGKDGKVIVDISW